MDQDNTNQESSPVVNFNTPDTTPVEPKTPAQQFPAPAPKTSNKSTLILIGIAVVVLIALIAVFIFAVS